MTIVKFNQYADLIRLSEPGGQHTKADILVEHLPHRHDWLTEGLVDIIIAEVKQRHVKIHDL